MSPLLPLDAPPPSGEVLVCCAALPAALPAELVARLRSLLPDDELARHDRFRHEGAAGEYLGARALVRAALSSWSPVDPRAWRFAVNEYGRPSVEAPLTAVATHFNLSHTRGMITLALGRDPLVGVDVEPLARSVDVLPIVDRFFSASEAAALRALPPAQHRDRFLALWTLKEAYIKARGMGLAIPLGDFSFEPDGDPVRIAFAPALDDDPGLWRFHRVDLDARHRVAVAAKVPALTVRLARVDLDAIARVVGLPAALSGV